MLAHMHTVGSLDLSYARPCLALLCLQTLALPAADAARDTWINGFGFTHMSEEQQTMVKKELRMLIFPGTSLLAKPLPQRAAAEPAPLNPGAAATADPGVLEASQAACEAAAKQAAEAAEAAESKQPGAAAAAGGVTGVPTAQQQAALQQQALQQQQQQLMFPMQLQGPLVPVDMTGLLAGSIVNRAVMQSGAMVLQPIAMSMGLPAVSMGYMPLGAPGSCDPGMLRGSSPAALMLPQLQMQLPMQQPMQLFDPAALLEQPAPDQQLGAQQHQVVKLEQQQLEQQQLHAALQQQVGQQQQHCNPLSGLGPTGPPDASDTAMTAVVTQPCNGPQEQQLHEPAAQQAGAPVEALQDAEQTTAVQLKQEVEQTQKQGDAEANGCLQSTPL
jgi:hypothetical protein